MACLEILGKTDPDTACVVGVDGRVVALDGFAKGVLRTGKDFRMHDSCLEELPKGEEEDHSRIPSLLWQHQLLREEDADKGWREEAEVVVL